MNTTTDIKKRIHNFVEHADERILKIMNAIVESETGKTYVPETHYQKLDEDREKYLRGEITSSTWEEVKKRLEKKYGF